MKYHTLFFPKIRKDVTNFGVCCGPDWHLGVNYALLSRGLLKNVSAFTVTVNLMIFSLPEPKDQGELIV